jgi:hypothetical protein
MARWRRCCFSFVHRDERRRCGGRRKWRREGRRKARVWWGIQRGIKRGDGEQVGIGGGAVWYKAEGKRRSRFLREGGRRQSEDESLHAEEVRARREEGVGQRWAAPGRKREWAREMGQARKRGREPREERSFIKIKNKICFNKTIWEGKTK